MDQIFSGVWKMTFGTPEQVTPVRYRAFEPDEEGLAALHRLDDNANKGKAVRESGKIGRAEGLELHLPFEENRLEGVATKRGYQVIVPLSNDEELYGLGLQLLSFNQRGKKKTLRVNSDPRVDLGDSHAPVPFLVSTKGWGIFADTARYATFYCGSATPVQRRQGEGAGHQFSVSSQDLYATRTEGGGKVLIIEVPAAEGVDLYFFGGTTMRQAVQRYNLFSGGGCLPPRWGLGVWYRCRSDFSQQQAAAVARQLRDEQMPCDVLGLEPSWETNSYSSSLVWNREKFPNPEAMTDELARAGYSVNLWTQIYVHPSSPLYGEFLPKSGDYEVWQGLVPDLSLPEVRQRMADFFEKEHVERGISGYKIDEVDNSDFINQPWCFPEASRFPSGLDGEQMHCLLGLFCQQMAGGIFRKRGERTFSMVRSSHGLAAPHPFVLYSDLYDHREFLRGVTTSCFSGLLWTPEVREAKNEEDLVRRVQSVMLSPLALFNPWYAKNPPWNQWLVKENNADQLAENRDEVRDMCRKALHLRMQLVPYVYAAFRRYCDTGLPPFRALVMDWPDDDRLRTVDDAWMIGDALLAAPVVAGQTKRQLVLPEGEWYDFWTGEKLTGGVHEIEVPLDVVPLYVKAGAILPLATPTQHTNEPESWNLTVRIYGGGRLGCELYEDDGTTYDYEEGDFAWLRLEWDDEKGRLSERREGRPQKNQYKVVAVDVIR